MSTSYVCTAEAPWTPDKSRGAIHPDAREIGEDYGSLGSGGSYVKYECPHCHERWRQMLPD